MDEEIIQRVIYIVIVVIILIINYAVRMQKKKVQAEQQKNISQELNKEIPATPSYNTDTKKTKVQEAFPPAEINELKTISSNNLQIIDTYVKKSSRMDSNYQSRMTKLQTKQLSTLKTEEEIFKFSHDELKKAIIYSEIITKREY